MKLQLKFDENQMREIAKEAIEGYCLKGCPYYEIFQDMLSAEKRIYAGTEDFVGFFKTIIFALGLENMLSYRVEEVDGELEIVIGGTEE